MFHIKLILAAGVTAMALALLSYSAQAATPDNFKPEHVKKVADGVYRYAPGDNYASMFVVTTKGVIAIEPVSKKHATGMLEAIKSVTDQPVRILLHSHNHWDHSRGGQVFRDAGAKIVAHKEAYDWMKANKHKDLALPDKGWNAKRKDITLGGTTVEMHYLKMSHGLGMTVFRVAEQKVLYVADLVTPNRVLFTFGPDFNMTGIKSALSEIEALDFDQMVVSHSVDGSYAGTKKDVVAFRQYIEDLQGAVVQELKKGTSFMEIPGSVKLPKYQDWAMYDQWLEMNVWWMMLEMYIGPFPWRPAMDFES